MSVTESSLFFTRSSQLTAVHSAAHVDAVEATHTKGASCLLVALFYHLKLPIFYATTCRAPRPGRGPRPVRVPWDGASSAPRGGMRRRRRQGCCCRGFLLRVCACAPAGAPRGRLHRRRLLLLQQRGGGGPRGAGGGGEEGRDLRLGRHVKEASVSSSHIWHAR